MASDIDGGDRDTGDRLTIDCTLREDGRVIVRVHITPGGADKMVSTHDAIRLFVAAATASFRSAHEVIDHAADGNKRDAIRYRAYMTAEMIRAGLSNEVKYAKLTSHRS